MAKRKRKADSELTAEERQRRDMQRATQQAALAARDRGEVFEPGRRTTFPKRKPLEARKEAARIAKRKSENAAKRRSAQRAVKAQRAGAPDIVVVPIFWKGEAKQMARVLSVCADVEKALEASEWRVELDTGHKYTPGQKFAHWEHKGVTLRIEIGPREAERGWCTVARTFAPGEPAHRVQKVSTDKLLGVLTELQAMSNPEATVDDDTAAPEHDDPALEAETRKQQRTGGDDLEDDFGGEDEGEVEEPKARRKVASAAAGGDAGAEIGGGSKRKSQAGAMTAVPSKRKVVSF